MLQQFKRKRARLGAGQRRHWNRSSPRAHATRRKSILAQQDVITELGARQKEAVAQIQDLRAKLDTLGKDRDGVASETLRVREAALHKELAEKQLAWDKSHDDPAEPSWRTFEEVLESWRKRCAEQTRITELEKQTAAADKYILGLKDKLQHLDNERAAQAQTFLVRERDLQVLIDEKTRLWGQTKDQLEEKLKVLLRASRPRPIRPRRD